MFYPTDPNESRSVFALRLGKYKAHFYTRGNSQLHMHIFFKCIATIYHLFLTLTCPCPSGAIHSSTVPDMDCPPTAFLQKHDPPLVFDLGADPSEHYPLKEDPDLLDRINKVKMEFEASMIFGESQGSKGIDPKLEPCCNPDCSPKPGCCHC